MDSLLNVNPGLIIWTIINFLIFLFIILKFGSKPIMNGLKAREERINSAIETAEKTKLEAEKLFLESEKRINSAKEEMYKMGYYGSFNGTPMIRIKQVHNVGTYTFKLSESDLYVTTGDEKPVKFITEGEMRIINGDALANQDLTQDYFSATQYGTGIVITDLFGKYAIS